MTQDAGWMKSFLDNLVVRSVGQVHWTAYIGQLTFDIFRPKQTVSRQKLAIASHQLFWVQDQAARRSFRIPWFHQLMARTSKARVFHSGADTLQVERDDGRRDSETSRDTPGNVSPRI